MRTILVTNTLTVLLLSAVVALATFCKKRSCGNNECSQYATMEVNKDCTGTYLRWYADQEKKNFKDYKVCNEKCLKKKSTGDMVSVCYKELSDCDRNDKIIVCDMLHETHGVIEVTKVE
jgi:hypothetical protein